jgi:hypothetical protein
MEIISHGLYVAATNQNMNDTFYHGSYFGAMFT